MGFPSNYSSVLFSTQCPEDSEGKNGCLPAFLPWSLLDKLFGHKRLSPSANKVAKVIFSVVSVCLFQSYQSICGEGRVSDENLGHPGHVPTCSTWTSLYNPLPAPQTCSNMFTMQLLLSASRQLAFD